MTTKQRIFKQAMAEGMPARLADLIAAQSQHETGNYTSGVFQLNNNCFGYKYVGQKIATKGGASPEGDSYARYKSIEDSVTEITGWIKRRQAEGKFPEDLALIQTPEQYATLLKRSGYFGAPMNEYIKGLTRWYRS
jgi:uncharacterized FlgJ-related protein